MSEKFSVLVAGLICLDVFPEFSYLSEGQFKEMFRPGGLITVGPAIFSTGGAVSNTGLALYRLGVPTRLVGKLGDDPFGGVVRGLVEQFGPSLADGLVTEPGQVTSYTLVISPPGVDRFFFHCPGANNAFSAEDIDFELVARSTLFHFGYPPVMRRMYTSEGVKLAEVFQRAKETGATTSLDMAALDPTTESGRVDWRPILRRTLPYVDVFMPSIPEILYALRRTEFDRLVSTAPGGDLLEAVTPELLSDLSAEIIAMGARVVGLKLGHRGLYLRTADLPALRQMGRAVPPDLPAWANRQIWAPCFRVQVVGTTGSGDATIAGFLSALLRGLSPEQAVTAAVAVGACNVEAADALSGIRSWEETVARIESGWERLPLKLDAPGWRNDPESGLWIGPAG